MKIYCPSCGKECNKNDISCTNCNYDLTQMIEFITSEEDQRSENIRKEINEKLLNSNIDASEIKQQETNIKPEKASRIIVAVFLAISIVLIKRSLIYIIIAVSVLLITIASKNRYQSKMLTAIPIILIGTYGLIKMESIKQETEYIEPNETINIKIDDEAKEIFNKVYNYEMPPYLPDPVKGSFTCINNELEEEAFKKLEINLKNNYTYTITHNDSGQVIGAYYFYETTENKYRNNNKNTSYTIIYYPEGSKYNEIMITDFEKINNKREGYMTYVVSEQYINEYYCKEK